MPAGIDPQQKDRVRQVREALELTQADFVRLLNEHGAGLDVVKWNRVEKGHRAVAYVEALAIAAVDPLDRGLDWVIRGATAPAQIAERSEGERRRRKR